MSKTDHTDGGGIRHRENCTCDLCDRFSDDSECTQCGGPVRPIERELVILVRCQHCLASRRSREKTQNGIETL